MRLRIMHNTNRLALALGYAPSDHVVEVYAFDYTGAEGDLDACEAAFEMFNIGHLSDHGTAEPDAIAYRERGNRSLSVGDVVACDGQFYACGVAGWREIAPPRTTVRTLHGTTPLNTD
jgi:hypothetical protein